MTACLPDDPAYCFYPHAGEDGEPGAFLFPRYAEGGGAYTLRTCWRTVCEDAKLGSLHRRED